MGCRGLTSKTSWRAWGTKVGLHSCNMRASRINTRWPPRITCIYKVRDMLMTGLNNMLKGFPTTNATALCTFAYSPGPGQEPILFEGRTEGKIVPARGPGHFGWDAVFQPVEGEGKTYAEMDGVAKNKISHRYRALEKLRVYLAEQK